MAAPHRPAAASRGKTKPPARVPITCKLPEETATLLKRYAEFLDSTQEYVVKSHDFADRLAESYGDDCASEVLPLLN